MRKVDFTRSGKMHKLLIADADDAILDSYTRLLEKYFDVSRACAVDDAFRMLARKEFSVAVVEVVFPGDARGGIEICNYIKEHTIATERIIHTAHKEAIDIKDAVETDVMFFLEKEDPRELVAKAIEARDVYLKKRGEESDDLSMVLTRLFIQKFDKCYGPQLINVCRRLRQCIHPDNGAARRLTYIIEDFIDLWCNRFQVEASGLPADSDKGWIEGFYWNDLEKDILFFSQYLFMITINDLYDHEDQSLLPDGIMPYEKIWDGSIMAGDFFDLEFSSSGGHIVILGMEPMFKNILINLLYNAIEAIDFGPWLEKSAQGINQPKILFHAEQDDDETIIRVCSDGVPFDEKLKAKFTEQFRNARKGVFNPYTRNMRERIKNEEFASRPGSVTGAVLLDAAYYLSRIQRSHAADQGEVTMRGWMEISTNGKRTEIIIHLPFGKLMTDEYETSPLEFNTGGKENRVIYKW